MLRRLPRGSDIADIGVASSLLCRRSVRGLGDGLPGQKGRIEAAGGVAVDGNQVLVDL